MLPYFDQARKFEIDGALSAIFFMKTSRYDCCFVSLTSFIYIWTSNSTVKHFPVDLIKFELEKQEKVLFLFFFVTSDI